jgi:hypothetical protein
MITITANTVTFGTPYVEGPLGQTWAGMRANTANKLLGSSNLYLFAGGCVAAYAGTADSWYSLYRGIVVFNTSIIPPTATIVSANLYVYYPGIINQLGVAATANLGLSIVKANPASLASITSADWASLTTAQMADDILYNSLVSSTQNILLCSLSSAGINLLSQVTNTAIGFQIIGDRTNSAPDKGTNSYDDEYRYYWLMNNTANRPYLEIGYTENAGNLFIQANDVTQNVMTSLTKIPPSLSICAGTINCYINLVSTGNSSISYLRVRSGNTTYAAPLV